MSRRDIKKGEKSETGKPDWGELRVRYKGPPREDARTIAEKRDGVLELLCMPGAADSRAIKQSAARNLCRCSIRMGEMHSETHGRDAPSITAQHYSSWLAEAPRSIYARATKRATQRATTIREKCV